jgi:tetratricopeptide (TPR) repeat protein
MMGWSILTHLKRSLRRSARQGFAEYARYLQHPLTLIGFVLLLVFGIHRALLRSGIIPPVSQRHGSRIVQLLLRYGFIIALVTIVLGFGLEFFKTSHKGLRPEDVTKVTTALTNYYLRSKQQQDAAFLNSVSDEEREKTVGSIREIADLVSKSGMTLSPEMWTGLGYAYLIINDMDKGKAALLEAIHGNPSLGEANFMLAYINQIQASEYLVKGDLNHARETLKAAEEYGKAALVAHPTDRSFGDQLGFIYKQLAQEDLARNDRDSEANELQEAETQFKASLGVDPNDAGAHNGLGTVYYLSGDYDKAIAEQQEAVRLQPTYTFAWHDLALILVDKYKRDRPPDPATLHRLNDVLDRVFALQQIDGAQKLPPEHLKLLEETRTWARAEAAKLPKSTPSVVHFNVSGVGSPGQAGSIEAAITQYDKYLRSVGLSVPGGSVQINITAANDQYVSYYDPSSETIFVNVRNADNTFWPLRDYTVRALFAGARTPLAPALLAILSGLATYYPSSSQNNPNYGPDYGGHLDQFRPLSELRPDNASPDGSSIWGSICWELRTMLDRDAADALLLKAWAQMRTANPAQPDDVRFASNIVELHKASGGSQADAIRLMFARRGLKL